MKLFACITFLFIGLASFGQKTITVAKTGKADFATVQAALDAIPSKNKKPVTIFIKNGIYKEKLHLDSTKDFVTIIGEDKFKTILTYNDHQGTIAPDGSVINTWSSRSFLSKGNNFTAKNITFQNDAGFTAGQAVALESNGDHAIFDNCRFIGFQDVLFTNSPNSRQVYNNCYIEGSTDFIFGSSTVWFEKCHIHSKKNSHVTAASTPKDHEFGFVFNECVLTADTAWKKVSLGRPWERYAAVAYLHCYIDRHIVPGGFAKWNQNDNHLTSRYFEYGNFGPGGNSSARESFVHQISDTDINKYTIANVLGGWNPLKK